MNLPGNDKRLSIIGSTGSGKTVAAVFHLSVRDYDRMPWLVYNFKDDRHIDGIPYARHIGVEEIPIKPGVYVAHPTPSDEETVEAVLHEIWKRQNTGVYVDEGYMLPHRSPAFRRLLTQGRSRNIPIIVLSQRPVWMDKFVFTESEYFQVFRLNNMDDRKNVRQFIPREDGEGRPIDLEKRLPKYHSHYYDLGEDKYTKLAPVPPIDKIHKTFEMRLAHKKKVV